MATAPLILYPPRSRINLQTCIVFGLGHFRVWPPLQWNTSQLVVSRFERHIDSVTVRLFLQSNIECIECRIAKRPQLRSTDIHASLNAEPGRLKPLSSQSPKGYTWGIELHPLSTNNVASIQRLMAPALESFISIH